MTAASAASHRDRRRRAHQRAADALDHAAKVHQDVGDFFDERHDEEKARRHRADAADARQRAVDERRRADDEGQGAEEGGATAEG